jgi:hypothetical protein
MSEAGAVAGLSGAALLELAVETLLAESPVELPEQVALDRTRTILACTERLAAARLAAIRDVDRRELFVLDAAGSTRGWLRTQAGGEGGQLSAARRLGERPLVESAVGAGRIGSRAGEQLCAVLDKVPAQVQEQQLTGVLRDGVGGLLQSDTGGLVTDDAVTPDLLAARARAQTVLEECVADRTGSPAQRLEPALVLLAEQLASSHLGPALRQLLEALLPDGSDGPERDLYFFELRELLDGDVDVRGHLTPEVGHGLAAEIARRVAQANVEARKTAEATDDLAIRRRQRSHRTTRRRTTQRRTSPQLTRSAHGTPPSLPRGSAPPSRCRPRRPPLSGCAAPDGAGTMPSASCSATSPT